MTAIKSGIAALLLLGGLSGTAQAQRFVGGNSLYPGAGTNLDYALFNGGYANYGQPAIYPNYPGYGGFGAPAGTPAVGSYAVGSYSTLPYLNAPKVYNNMGGVIGAIQQSTGKSGSYRNGAYTGVSRARRGR